MTTFFIILAALILIIGLSTSSNNVVEKKPKEEKESEKEEESGWVYEEKKDPMTDEIKIITRLESQSYSGALIFIPHLPEAGSTDVGFVMVNDYPILEPSYGDEKDEEREDYIRVRFDSEPAKKCFYSKPEPNDKDSDDNKDLYSRSLYIWNDFIENCKSAKRILIEIPLVGKGRTIFEFNTNKPLEWK